MTLLDTSRRTAQGRLLCRKICHPWGTCFRNEIWNLYWNLSFQLWLVQFFKSYFVSMLELARNLYINLRVSISDYIEIKCSCCCLYGLVSFEYLEVFWPFLWEVRHHINFVFHLTDFYCKAHKLHFSIGTVRQIEQNSHKFLTISDSDIRSSHDEVIGTKRNCWGLEPASWSPPVWMMTSQKNCSVKSVIWRAAGKASNN